MNVLEKFSDNNLFEAINNIQSLPFAGLDGINNYWLAKYGTRQVLPQMQDMEISIIAMVIHSLYYSKWVKLYENYDIDVLENGNKSETTTKVITDTGENTSTVTGENNHLISAFDSDTMTDDTTDNENRTTKDNSKNDRKETTIVEGRSGNYTNDFVTYNKYLTNTQFFDMLCIDVNNAISSGTITLDI